MRAKVPFRSSSTNSKERMHCFVLIASIIGMTLATKQLTTRKSQILA